MQEDLEEEACSKGSSDSSEDAIQMILKTAEPLLPGGEKMRQGILLCSFLRSHYNLKTHSNPLIFETLTYKLVWGSAGEAG